MDSSFETVDNDRPSGATRPTTRSRRAESFGMDLFKNPTAEHRGSLLCAREDVTQDVPEHKAKHLLFTPHPYGTVRRFSHRVSALPKPRRGENGYLLARFSITLDENGHLRPNKRLHEGLDVEEDGRLWFAYVESDTPCDNQIHVDTLNGEVASRYPETESEDVSIPWAKDLPETFSNAYGPDADLIGSIPELIWDLPGDAPSLARYRFHKHVNSAIDLSLRSTVNDVPLAGRMLEYTKAKQRASIARQNGKRAAASLVRAGPSSSFTLEAYKASGDWQSALGLSIPSRGPVSVDFHIPWWKECGFVEDHFARVNVAMARGRPVTRVAVVDPIESAWIRFGPGTNFPLRRDREFVRLASWLFRGLVDFDVVSESLLPSQITGDVWSPLRVGNCAYDVVILPKMRTIRSTTLAAVRSFAAAGGKVVIVGDSPSLIDAQIPQADNRSLDIVSCTRVTWSQEGLLEAISDQRDLKIDHADGRRGQSFLHQMRESGNDERLVFICNTDRTSPYDTVVRIKGDWDVDVLDTFNGAVNLLKSRSEKRWTVFEHRFEGCASLLLRLRAVPAEDLSFVEVAADAVLASPKQESIDLKLEEVLLSEPNVLLLDRVCYRIDDDPWDATEPQDIVKIDSEIRSRLRLPARGRTPPETTPQPEKTARAYVDLRFEFESSLLVEAPTHLAMENPGNARIAINGHKLPLPAEGDKDAKAWWRDERIRTVPIPGRTIRKGTNTIELSMPFGSATALGRLYLLGSFSIDISGGPPVLRERRRGLGWGNVVTQGHPFYAGDVTYRCTFSLGSRSDVILSATQFAAPVVRVRWGNGRSGHIALRPRRLNLGELEAGRHEVCITAFGGRQNAFGDVHLAADSRGHEYKLTPTGILEKPTLIVEAKIDDGEDWVVLAE
ncbi:glycoside hydrolase family sugar binding protein [Colletotrichum sojae]|uniref:Glycoside hydrolase family sugar binding protein n=1 Tax=Colletotrichum sojae TaxID=2175907 RepID=A0A8H6JE92_9PEZI|nr:glycoside hydrolase family sugar binding protein [Colletotrichum sojae]